MRAVEFIVERALSEFQSVAGNVPPQGTPTPPVAVANTGTAVTNNASIPPKQTAPIGTVGTSTQPTLGNQTTSTTASSNQQIPPTTPAIKAQQVQQAQQKQQFASKLDQASAMLQSLRQTATQ